MSPNFTIEDGFLGNFGREKLPIYQEALAKYSETKKMGLRISEFDWNHSPVNCSLWCYPDCGDLSDFWELFRNIKEKYTSV